MKTKKKQGTLGFYDKKKLILVFFIALMKPLLLKSYPILISGYDEG